MWLDGFVWNAVVSAVEDFKTHSTNLVMVSESHQTRPINIIYYKDIMGEV